MVYCELSAPCIFCAREFAISVILRTDCAINSIQPRVLPRKTLTENRASIIGSLKREVRYIEGPLYRGLTVLFGWYVLPHGPFPNMRKQIFVRVLRECIVTQRKTASRDQRQDSRPLLLVT